MTKLPHPTHLKIFISSTFLDMHNERETLLKKVFVKLKKEAKLRGVEVTEIDLRWGITEEEAYFKRNFIELNLYEFSVELERVALFSNKMTNKFCYNQDYKQKGNS